MRSLLFLFAGAFAFAQETPTERLAAHDVLTKMSDLERVMDVRTVVERLTVTNAQRDQTVARAKELMDKELLAMSDDITRHPEIGFEETRSVKTLTDYLKQHGFEVTMGIANLRTAFIARYKGNNGAPNLGVILEYDALRGTTRAFHGDQHSSQGPVGMAAAIAIAELLEKTHMPGSVTVIGTPGEEMMPPNAKTDMFKAGVFNGVDILVRSHSTSQTTRPAAGFGTCCLNIDGVKYIFSGAPSHQMTPWAGRNALEGVIQLFNNIDAMRSTIRPEARVQGVITEGGAAPNVVPDRAVADFYIRYPDEVYLAQVREGRGQCGKGGGAGDRDQGEDRQLRSGSRWNFGGVVIRTRVRVHEEVRPDESAGGAGKAAGLRRDGQRFERDSGRRVPGRDVELGESHL